VVSDPAYGTLMEEMGGRVLDEDPEDTWGLGLRRLAELQLAWVGASGALLAAGAQDRPIASLGRLVGELEPVHARLAAAEPGAWPAWGAVADGIADRCASLAASDLPDTLVHGDFHPGNVNVRDGEALLFDWSDGAVSHPFADLTCFLRRAATPATRRHMADAYLGVWAAGYGMTRVERALEDALVVGALYQVATYLALVPAMDLRDRWQFEAGPWRWLRFAIRPLELSPRS
jgi:Ser/Thr protein kinase RdoA (MazF antagonist)